MNKENISISGLEAASDGYTSVKTIMPGEVEGISIERISLKGKNQLVELPHRVSYDTLLTLKGNAFLEIQDGGEEYRLDSQCIARLPYTRQYTVRVRQGEEFHFLRFRKSLDDADIERISQHIQDHTSVYIKALNECQLYTEDIVSSESINRMILPEGMVPRFCMGSVETVGPDRVAEHDHPMLDQLFFGLEGCKCTCFAGAETAVLTENMMLHIPIGSTHTVSVEEGDKLHYIWLDFFLTLEGQKYMGEQHKMKDE